MVYKKSNPGCACCEVLPCTGCSSGSLPSGWSVPIPQLVFAACQCILGGTPNFNATYTITTLDPGWPQGSCAVWRQVLHTFSCPSFPSNYTSQLIAEILFQNGIARLTIVCTASAGFFGSFGNIIAVWEKVQAGGYNCTQPIVLLPVAGGIAFAQQTNVTITPIP